MMGSIAALLFSLATASFAHAQMQFQSAVAYGVGDKPEGGTLVDFDHDGDLDLAVSTEHPDKVEFLTNLGNGTFQPAFALPTGNATSPEGLAAADFDNDGDVDLAAALFSANQVQLLVNQGNGTFALGAKFNVQSEPSVVVAADLNLDGRVDAAVNNRAGGSVSVLVNDGAGGFFGAVHYAVGAETRGLAAADLDGDGRPDLAVSSRDDRRVRLFKSVGDGSLSTLVDLSLGAILKPQGVSIADLDVDGALDVVTATSGTFPLQEHPSVFVQNNGGNHWVGPINGSVLPGISPTGIATADFDLDGVPDAATSNADTNNVSVMRSSGIAGIFNANRLILPIGDDPKAPMLFVGDLDANGSADLVSLNVGSDDVSVLLNKKVSQPDLGFGGPGTATIAITGDVLSSGGTATLHLTGASPNSLGVVLASTGFAPTPFFGGTICPIPFDFALGFGTNAQGGFTLPGIHGGGGTFDVYVQCVIVDSNQPQGFAFSNVVKAHFQP